MTKTSTFKVRQVTLLRPFLIVASIIGSVVCSTPQVVLASNHPAAEATKINVANFQYVSDSLWRGAAPTDIGIHQLANKGVRTIIDLRMNTVRCRHEKQTAEELGLNYVHMPMGFEHASNADVTKFLKIVSDPVNLPVFIHCHQGADRTGVLVGIYRILVENWTFDHTYKEMRSHHFKPWLFGMKNSVVVVARKESVRQSLQGSVERARVTEIDSSEI